MKTRTERYARYRKKIQSLPDRKFPLEGRFGKSSEAEVSKVMQNILAKELISFDGKRPASFRVFAQSEQRERRVLSLKIMLTIAIVLCLIALFFLLFFWG